MVDEQHGTAPDTHRRRDLVAVVVGLVLTVVGILGVVLGVLGDSVSTTTGSVVWLLVGVLVLGFGTRARHHRTARS